MRVPAGTLVRPTQDRVREAIFSMLMNDLPGARFLDLFAGSGAVGLEAFSRSGCDVVWVENNRKVSQVTRRNIEELGGDADAVICADAITFLKRAAQSGRHFDIVFADPPYVRREEDASLLRVADFLSKGVLADGGLLVLEQAKKAVFRLPEGWQMFKERVYGGSVIRLLSQL